MESTTAPSPPSGRELAPRIKRELHKRVVGQDHMIDRLLIGMLTGGHVLLEGVPGLAKTLTVSSLADALDVTFQRIQFTPDLLPADVVGTMIYNQRTGEFTPPGINCRARAKAARLWAFDILEPGIVAKQSWPSPHGGRLLAQPGGTCEDEAERDRSQQVADHRSRQDPDQCLLHGCSLKGDRAANVHAL